MKFVTVVGARPQFIKAATVSRMALMESDMQEILIHTGQHFDKEMSDIFFSQLEIPKPDYFLGVQADTHASQTGRMLESIEQVLLKEKPDCLLVYGDTNSTLAGALASVKLHIPVLHVEAGLRSFNRQMPEEVNRILTDHCSDFLFTPTDMAVENLRREGVSEKAIYNVGDVMYDAALYYGGKAEVESSILREFKLETNKYMLATIHRAENTDNPVYLQAIFEGLCNAGSEVPIILPLHPRTRKALDKLKLLREIETKLKIINPVGYLDMVNLVKNASLVVTDSGGLQKEAFFFGVPCITLRSETEWVELVDLEWNRLVHPINSKVVYKGILGALGSRGKPGQPYGEGQAARKIINKIKEIFN